VAPHHLPLSLQNRPFWLSPFQISVVPVAPSFYDYGKRVRDIFIDAGFFADLDNSGDTMNKKIRNAQVEQYNFIFGNPRPLLSSVVKCLAVSFSFFLKVVGEKEEEANSVNIRTRDNVVHGTFSIEETITRLSKLSRSRNKVDEF